MARKTYSAEFRRDAVELYRTTEGATIKQIAGDLGITDATLSTWVKTAGNPCRFNAGDSQRPTTTGTSIKRQTGGAGRQPAWTRARSTW